MRRIATSDDGNLPGGSFFELYGMYAGADRVVFAARGDRSAIFSYRLGEPSPTAVVRAGDATEGGVLFDPIPFGVGDDGRVYFADALAEEGRDSSVFSWHEGTIRYVDTPAAILWSPSNGVSAAGTLMALTDSAVRLAGAAANQASCPYPPTVIVPPATPTPTLRPGEPTPPPDLPFTPQDCTPNSVCLRVASVGGAAGERVQVDVRLDTGGVAVAGTENELHFAPPALIHDCVRNDAIGKRDTAFAIFPNRTKAIVVSLVDLEPIPDGAVMYTCEVEIAASAAPGHYLLSCAYPGAAAPNGSPLASSCADGVLTVEATESGSAPQLAHVPASGGCAIQPGGGRSGWIVLLSAPAVGLCRRRHGARRW